MAHCAVRPSLKRISVWNRSPDRAQRLVDTSTVQGVTLSVADDLESVARSAELISCATMATAPLIKGEWLQPGTHLDLVGSFRPNMRECDEAAIRRASVFVDSRWSAVEDCGEIIDALASGALTDKDILADNFDLARGQHPGRASDNEITLYKNGGGGHLDLMVAQYLCGMA